VAYPEGPGPPEPVTARYTVLYRAITYVPLILCYSYSPIDAPRPPEALQAPTGPTSFDGQTALLPPPATPPNRPRGNALCARYEAH
jgi:hypothetical protein